MQTHGTTAFGDQTDTTRTITNAYTGLLSTVRHHIVQVQIIACVAKRTNVLQFRIVTTGWQ